MTVPDGLAAGGRRLWERVSGEFELDALQADTLELACRQRDRVDALAEQIAEGGPDAGLLRAEREGSLALARLLAACRFPDEATGKRPQRRQLRGAQRPSSGASSAKDRLRAVPS